MFKTIHSVSDGRYVDLTPAQMVLALGGARPTTSKLLNRLLMAWARASGFSGCHYWSIRDLEDAGLAVRVLTKKGTPSKTTFRWVDPQTGRLL